MRIFYITLSVAAAGWLGYSIYKAKKFDFSKMLPQVAALGGTLLLNIFPAIAWVLLLGALAWGVYLMVKNKGFELGRMKLPLIAVAAALVLVVTMPGGVLGGGSAGSSGDASGNRISSREEARDYFIIMMEYTEQEVAKKVEGPVDMPLEEGKSTVYSTYVVVAFSADNTPLTYYVTDNGSIYMHVAWSAYPEKMK